MPPTTTYAKRLGYGGSATIGGVQVLITSGSMDIANSISYMEMLDTPPDTSARTRVKHADGVQSFSATIGFDLTVGAMGIVGQMISRNNDFNIGINDGEYGWIMNGCKIKTVVLSGAAGGLVTATVSFSGLSAFTSGMVTNSFIRDSETLVGYWWSGTDVTDVKDWSFTFNQAVQEVYGNLDGDAGAAPLYLRVGLTDYNLSVNLYENIGSATAVKIATNQFTLTGNVASQGFNYGGVSELGNYSYGFETSVVGTSGSDYNVLTIT